MTFGIVNMPGGKALGLLNFMKIFKPQGLPRHTRIKRYKYIFYDKHFRTCIDSRIKWREIRNLSLVNHVSDSSQESIPLPTVDLNFYDNITLNQRQTHEFNFMHFRPEEVLRSLIDVQFNEIGYDCMHPKFARLTLPYTFIYFTHFFNTIVTTSTYFLPISILPYLSKVFQKLVYLQISSYLYTNSLLTERKSEFRTQHSFRSALVDVSEEIRCQIDKRHTMSFLVLLDNSKAFDTVHHSILKHELKYMCNFSSTAFILISSYLNDRSQTFWYYLLTTT